MLFSFCTADARHVDHSWLFGLTRVYGVHKCSGLILPMDALAAFADCLDAFDCFDDVSVPDALHAHFRNT